MFLFIYCRGLFMVNSQRSTVNGRGFPFIVNGRRFPFIVPLS
jgi:hypothetical protein